MAGSFFLSRLIRTVFLASCLNNQLVSGAPAARIGHFRLAGVDVFVRVCGLLGLAQVLRLHPGVWSDAGWRHIHRLHQPSVATDLKQR